MQARLQRSGLPHPERITKPPLELCLQSEFTPGVGSGAFRLASKAPAILTSPSRANHESAVGALLAKRIHARGGQRSLSPCEQGSNDPDLPILSESRICRWSFACKANSRPWRVTGSFALRARLQRFRGGVAHRFRLKHGILLAPLLSRTLQAIAPGRGHG